jgi:phosphatidylglycerol:prolipoprotein diacylglycerol transferase
MSLADMDDLLLWATLGIILGGRLGYAIFYQPGHYLDNPLGFFRLWEGGMSFHGGLTGTIVAIALFALRRHIPMLPIFDVVSAAGPIGLFFGRIANFINGELWGRASDVPWAMVFCNPRLAAPEGACPAGLEPRHPSQLYEAALEGIVLFLVLRVLTHRFGSLGRPGLTAGAFGAGYGASRIFVEFFREPDAQLGTIAGPFTMGMLLSLPMVLIGLVAMAYALRRQPA